MKKIFNKKTLPLLALFTCFFVVQNAHAKVASSRAHRVDDRNPYSDEGADYLENEIQSSSRFAIDLVPGMGEFSSKPSSILSLDELKKDIRDIQINIDETSGEISLNGSVPVDCAEHLSVEAVRPAAYLNNRVGFKVSDFTGKARACLAKFRGKTCSADTCVSLEELTNEDSQRFQARVRLEDFKDKRFIVSVQTYDQSKKGVAWADFGQIETLRTKLKTPSRSHVTLNSSSSRLGSSSRAHLGKSSRDCNENVVDQFVVNQPMAPMMMPHHQQTMPQFMPQMMRPPMFGQPMMQPGFGRPMFGQAPMFGQQMMRPPMMGQSAFGRPMFGQPPMFGQNPMIRPMPQFMPSPQMTNFRPSLMPRPPVSIPPFVNGGCPTGCAGGYGLGLNYSNLNQTLPVLRYPQVYPRNNFQLSLNGNFRI